MGDHGGHHDANRRYPRETTAREARGRARLHRDGARRRVSLRGRAPRKPVVHEGASGDSRVRFPGVKLGIRAKLVLASLLVTGPAFGLLYSDLRSRLVTQL